MIKKMAFLGDRYRLLSFLISIRVICLPQSSETLLLQPTNRSNRPNRLKGLGSQEMATVSVYNIEYIELHRYTVYVFYVFYVICIHTFDSNYEDRGAGQKQLPFWSTRQLSTAHQSGAAHWTNRRWNTE